MSEALKTPEIASLGNRCCGCGACAGCCPKTCISMVPDSAGFCRPAIDPVACVGCGACDSVCPALNVPEKDECVSAFWAKAHDENVLDRSSSGGVFGLLAKDALLGGGIVAGAAWMNDCRELHHLLVRDGAELDCIMRSKYVQSSIDRDVYVGVRNALQSGRQVLFCGTACQVAGMRSYLGKLADSSYFLGIDVICHGVPSPLLWRKWLKYVEAREAGEVHEVNFRSKITGWLSYSVMYKYMTEKDNASRFSATKFADDWYMRAFLKNASLRSSCLECPFKRECGSDITLGDYWGIQRQHPDVPVEGGVSAVLVNTAKGAKAIDRIADYMSLGQSSCEKVVAGNSALVNPVEPHPERAEFLHAVAEGSSIPEMMERWSFEPTFRQKLVAKAKGAVKKLLTKA